MERPAQDVGIILVHGVGEQAQLDHLRSIARDLASYIGQEKTLLRLAICDHTIDAPASGPDAGTIVVDAVVEDAKAGERRVRLHLHEVWWADLGMRGGLFDHLRFWLWALGQWAAARVNRASLLDNTEKMMAMPRFAGQAKDGLLSALWRKAVSRFLLFGAGMLAILTFFTWSAAKRLFALLSDHLPAPSLIFLFLGDVKIYERSRGPGKGTLLDPDMPARATIRRRMVSTMTEVAARDYDRWYILAHSLGSVVAWNAVQELEIALPNYLSEENWRRLPRRLKTSHPFVPPGEVPNLREMMPRRPPWLAATDGISRARLFERFAGLVTYGSPLDKFAALWPRIVPLNRQAQIFPRGAEWVNLYDRTDPVAAHLDAFAVPAKAVGAPGTAAHITLEPRNLACASSWLFGISHIRYLLARRAGAQAVGAGLVKAMVDGSSLSAAMRAAEIGRGEAALRLAGAITQLLLLFAALTVAAGALLHGLGKLLPPSGIALAKEAIGAISQTMLRWLEGPTLQALAASMLLVLALTALATLLSGLIRLVFER